MLRSFRILACVVKFAHDWDCLQEKQYAQDICWYISYRFRSLLRRHGVSRVEIARCDTLRHHWIIVDEYQIDFTARQFDESTKWPLIWPKEENHPCIILEENGEATR